VSLRVTGPRANSTLRVSPVVPLTCRSLGIESRQSFQDSGHVRGFPPDLPRSTLHAWL